MFFNYREAADFPLALKISYDIREQTWEDEPILVFETAWPKLGPSIYYLSEREPPFPNLFFFPWVMSPVEIERLSDAIDSQTPSLIVLLGPDPSIPAVIQLQEKIHREYQLIEEYTDDSGIYPHIQETTIYVRIYVRQSR